MIHKIKHEFWSDLFHNLLKERSKDDVTIKTVLLPYIEQFHAAMPLFCIRSQKTQMNYENPWHTGAPLCLLSVLTSFLSHIWSITEQKYRSIDTVFLKTSIETHLIFTFGLSAFPAIIIRRQETEMAANKCSNIVIRKLLNFFQQAEIVTQVSARKKSEHAQPTIEIYLKYGWWRGFTWNENQKKTVWAFLWIRQQEATWKETKI